MQNKIITHLNFAKGFRGGERQTLLLIQELAKQGYKQKIITRMKSELANRLKGTLNLEIITISKPYILHLSKFKESDILHAHETKAAQVCYFANLIYKIPYIITRRVDNKIKTNFLNRQIYTNAKVSVALSHAIEKEIHAIAPNAVTAIIPSAYVDTKINNDFAKKIKKKYQDKYLIGHVGALDDGHKGQSFLIQAAKKFEKSHPNMHFLFLGRGEDENMLKLQAKGLSNVTFEGFVENVNDYITTFDLFVFPSRNEGLGSILLDVMGLNIPIIASNVGGIPDIIKDKYNGLLIEPQNALDIEEKILTLYKNPLLAKELVQNAKKDIQNYSPQCMALKYQKIYENQTEGIEK